MSELPDRVRGCLVGGAVGDAFGGPIEMRSAEELNEFAGTDWVDQLLPYRDDHGVHPLGVWQEGPPRGTGTDDTRNNQMFVECAVRTGGVVNSQLLAIEYVQRYLEREKFYPEHADLAERHLRGRYHHALAYLGAEQLPDGTPGWVARARGNAFPALAGLISLAPAGLLHPGDPEAAYRRAFELAYCDLGYARDATAMLAAMVSTALGSDDACEVVEAGLRTDPFGYGKRRIMARRIRRFLEIAEGAGSDRELIEGLSPEVSGLHLFDPVDILGVPVAALRFSRGDPVRTIVMAANDRDLTAEGALLKLRDVDCTAGVAGALVGALRGAEAFPSDWVEDTIEANRQVYGIDLERNARELTALLR